MAERRGRGEGSVFYDDRRQRWVGLASYWQDGKLRRKWVSGRTRQEAQRRLREVLAGLDRGVLPADDRQTVAQYLNHWLEHVARHRVRPTTFRRYAELVRLHALPQLGGLPLAKLTAQHLERLYAAKLAEGLSPRTVEFLHAVLRAALKHAVRQGLRATNPTDAVQAPRPRAARLQPLDAEQARRLLQAAQGDDLEALVTLALMTGMREGELLGLRWQDVDLERGRLHVRHTLQWLRGGQWQLAEPKTPRARRTIRLPATAVEALRRQRVRLAELRLRAGPAWADHDLVFPNTSGAPLSASTLQHGLFPRLLARAGLPRIRFHDLRHTYATLALRNGESPKVVQETLGHASVTITLDTYSHVLPEVQEQAAERMERLLSGNC